MADPNDIKIEKSKPFLRVYAMLMGAAQQRGFVTSTDVADIVDDDPARRATTQAVTKMLRVIDRRERQCRRPMLSAVVVSPSDHRPPAGFYKTAIELGLLVLGSSVDDRANFWNTELDRLFLEWSDFDELPAGVGIPVAIRPATPIRVVGEGVKTRPRPVDSVRRTG